MQDSQKGYWRDKIQTAGTTSRQLSDGTLEVNYVCPWCQFAHPVTGFVDKHDCNNLSQQVFHLNGYCLQGAGFWVATEEMNWKNKSQ